MYLRIQALAGCHRQKSLGAAAGFRLARLGFLPEETLFASLNGSLLLLQR